MESVKPECSCLSKRYTMGILACFGFIIVFGMRCNIAMAKVYSQGVAHANWTVATESGVDSVFFWGYLIIQIPGGILATAYPPNRIFGAAIICSSFLNLLVPAAIAMSSTGVIIVRFLQGLAEGVTFPACLGIWRSWAPPLERSRLVTLTFSGSYAGIVLGMPLSGILSDWISWQASFYCYGIFGITWYLLWLWLTFETPAKHPSTSVKEFSHIEKSIGPSINIAMPKIASYPWRYFFMSMPVYAIIVANFCQSWSYYLLMLYHVTFFRQKFQIQLSDISLIALLPMVIMMITVPVGGVLADYLQQKQILSTTKVRKIFNCWGFGLEALSLIVVAYSKTASTAFFALMVGVIFNAFAISGFHVNHLDIAPRYVSILMVLSNVFGILAGLICPIFVDIITTENRPENWTIVFLLAACIHLVGVIFYAIFASGELQRWAEPRDEVNRDVNMTKTNPETRYSFPLGQEQEHEFSIVEL